MIVYRIAYFVIAATVFWSLDYLTGGIHTTALLVGWVLMSESELTYRLHQLENK